jgi:hypothetical protein
MCQSSLPFPALVRSPSRSRGPARVGPLRSRPLLAGVASFLLLAGILLPLLLPRPSRVRRANYERVEEGMSRPEVEENLDGPEGT